MQIKIAIIGAGINAVVKALAEPFSVNLGCRITCLQRSQQQWLLHDEHEQPPKVDFDALRWHPDAAGPLDWLALDHTKPGRSAPATVVAHTHPAWARKHLESKLETVQENMLSEVCKALELPRSAITFATLHRWRYAKAAVHKGASFYLDSTAQIAACGDWAHQGRVEAAFTSAHDLAHTIHAQLTEGDK